MVVLDCKSLAFSYHYCCCNFGNFRFFHVFRVENFENFQNEFFDGFFVGVVVVPFERESVGTGCAACDQ